MANILDRYGIKEVADVTFYELSKAGLPTYPVLYLDTLKVSTIEQTAETSDAKGGKGNAALISWDYGKEITVTLEDALFSAKSMAIMFGNGTVKDYVGSGSTRKYIMKSEQFQASGTPSGATVYAQAESVGWEDEYEAPNGKTYQKLNPKFYDADGNVISGTGTSVFEDTEKYFCSFDIAVAGSVIEVSASSFPGTYYVTGDTYARSEASGEDEFFQFIIPKAKVQSENTITMEAEGDPSTFNMSLKVLRPSDGVMMRLVKYDAVDSTGDASEKSVGIQHNHVLNAAAAEVVTLSGAESTATRTNPYALTVASTDTTKVTAQLDSTTHTITFTGVAATTDAVIVTASDAGGVIATYSCTVGA